MDSLPEDEIEAIWQRNKRYIDLKQIKSINKQGIQEEIKNAMRNASVPAGSMINPQANNNFLIERGFPEQASENPKILNELLQDNIRKIKIRGADRFQIASGTPSFFNEQGKRVRAGQFLAGRTEEKAIESLRKKSNL